MKRILILAFAIVVFIGLIVAFKGGDEALPESMIGEGVTLYRVAFAGIETNKTYIHVPFVVESEVVRHLSIGLDLNNDGEITPSDDENNEWVVRNVVPIISEGENLRFPVELTDRSIGREKEVDVVFFYSNEPLAPEAVQHGQTDLDFIRERAKIDSLEIDEMEGTLRIDEEGNKRTGASLDDAVSMVNSPFTIENANASESGDGDGDGRPDYFNHQVEGMPDQDQEYNECSPTSVANSFEWLAETYGFDDLMPEDIGSTIDELKADLEWDSGTKDENIIPGKQLFVDRHDLPIEVHQIGTQNDPDIHWKIYEELKKGQAVEVSLQFYKTENGERKKSGGHMVAVSGISGGPDFSGIRFNDSATDASESDASGDLYSMDGNKLKGFWTDKEVEIEFAYAQSPIESVTDGTWTMPSGSDFVVGQDHQLQVGGLEVAKGISRFGFFNSFIDHPGDHFVGESFTVVTTVVMRQDERQYMFWTDDDGESQAYWHAATAPWTLKGDIAGNGVIIPKERKDVPPTTSISGDRFRVEQTFTCEKPGLASVTYEANVTWTIEDSGELPADTRARYEDQLKPEASITINSPIFKCLTTDAGSVSDSSGLSMPESACAGIVEDPDGMEVEVLKLAQGACFPKEQFTVGSAQDPCEALHWHGGPVYSLTGETLTDPSPNSCGYGKVGEVEEATIKIDEATAARFLGASFSDVDTLEGEPSEDVEFSDVEGLGGDDAPIEYRDGADRIEVRGLEGLNPY